MRKTSLFLVFACAVTLLTAQTLSPKVIGTAGGLAPVGGGALSFTIGEASLISTFRAGGNTLTQGFQQPNEMVSGLIEIAPNSFVVYPCPAISYVWFGFELPEPGKVTMALYNSADQRVMEPYQINYQSGKIIEHMNVAALPSGIYFLTMLFTRDNDGKKLQLSQKLEVIK